MATQPNLPQYQLSKLPDMLAANMQQVNAAAVAAMTNLGTRLAKQKEERKKLIKEGDAIEANFNDFFANKEKSGVIDADAANREWAGKAARNLNDLYIKAYGSNGTLADREAYKEAKSRSMEDVNNLGTFASLVGMNNKAIEADLLARKQGTSVGRLTNNSLTGSYKNWYNRTTEINNGTATNYKVSRDANGHQILTYNLLNTNGKGLQQENGKDIVKTVDVNAWVNEFNKTGKGLEALTVKPDQSLQTGLSSSFDKDYVQGNLLGPPVDHLSKKYDVATGTYITTKGKKYTSVAEQVEKDPNGVVYKQIVSDTKKSTFPQTYFALSNEGFNDQGNGIPLPLADQPWKVGNTVTDEELKQFNTNKELTAKDPTPGDGASGVNKLTRQDLNDIQQKSAEQMLINFYNNQTRIGDVTTAESDVERYKRTSDNSDWTAGQKRSFTNMRGIYNAVNTQFDNLVWSDKDDHSKPIKIKTLDQYKSLLNKINAQEAKATDAPAVKYWTGAELNAGNFHVPGQPRDPNKLYVVKEDNQGGAAKVSESNFSVEDLKLKPEDFYNTVKAQYNLDDIVTNYLDKLIGG